jgi:beta-lactamase class D
MKKSLLTITFCLLSNLTFANHQIENKDYLKNNCLLIHDEKKFLVKEGGSNCEIRFSPCSTFKIAISLMGYDSGFLINKTDPLIDFREGYNDSLDSWRKSQTPQTWIKNSCVWYSQLITRHIGFEKFNQYLDQFDYGNRNFDVYGKSQEKWNNLNKSWISSTLKISPIEQIFFLKKILDKKFNLANDSINKTKEILFIEDLENSWKLYGKTGSCDLEESDSPEMQSVWFIGWVEKNNQKIIFANYLEDIESRDFIMSKIAKDNLLAKINEILKNKK